MAERDAAPSGRGPQRSLFRAARVERWWRAATTVVLANRAAKAVLPGRAATSSRAQIKLMWSRYDSLCCLAVLCSGVRRFDGMRPAAALQACLLRARGRRHADRNA